MILLYTVGFLLLGIGAFITHRRARSLERKYMVAAQQADQLVKQLSFKNGNSNHADLFTNAKRQYELGKLVQVRDKLETKYDSWTSSAEHFRRWRAGLLGWKGRFVPYALGAIDLTMIVAIIVALGGIDPESLRKSIDTVRAVVRR
jgi:hypothetical protein